MKSLHRYFALFLMVLSSVSMGVAGAQQFEPAQQAAKPLKIVVYGGNGHIGSRIVNEALMRGHRVIVVDRAVVDTPAGQSDSGAGQGNAGKRNKKLKRVVGDVFSLEDLRKNMKGQDVVVTAVAVRPIPSRDFYVRLAQNVVEAQRSLNAKNRPRFMMVGGASSLQDESGRRIFDTMPANTSASDRNAVGALVDALDYLRTVNDTSWTFFSPAAQIAPGKRTKKYRKALEKLIRDGQGQSQISTEDFAVAMLDELERPQHINQRFTVGY